MTKIVGSNIQPPDFNPDKGDRRAGEKPASALPSQGADEFKVASVQDSKVPSVELPANVDKVAPPIPSAVSGTTEIAEVVRHIVDAVEGFGQFLSAGATERLGRLAFGAEGRVVDGLPISDTAKVKLTQAAIDRKNNQVS